MADQPQQSKADELKVGPSESEKGAAAGLLAALGCGSIGLIVPVGFGVAVLIVLALGAMRGCA